MGLAQSWTPSPSISSISTSSSQHEAFSPDHLVIEDISDKWSDDGDAQYITPYEYEEYSDQESELHGQSENVGRSILPCSSPSKTPSRTLAIMSHPHMDDEPLSSEDSSQSSDSIHTNTSSVDMNRLSSCKPPGKKRKADSPLEDTYQILFPVSSQNQRKRAFSETINLAEIIRPKKRHVILPRLRQGFFQSGPSCRASVFPSMHSTMDRHFTSEVPVGAVDAMDLD